MNILLPHREDVGAEAMGSSPRRGGSGCGRGRGCVQGSRRGRGPANQGPHEVGSDPQEGSTHNQETVNNQDEAQFLIDNLKRPQTTTFCLLT